MELIISRMPELYEGMQIALKENGKLRPLALVNGNKPDFKGPVILSEIDQHAVYGLSHPAVVSRIYAEGPQMLLTTRDLAHNIFEHGMKAALGQVRMGGNMFFTKMETFYTVSSETQNMRLIAGRRGKSAVIIRPREDCRPVVIAPRNFQPKEPLDEGAKSIEIDSIKTFTTAAFEPY
jgi:hypothetical protein